jgi:hypothetical protein
MRKPVKEFGLATLALVLAALIAAPAASAHFSRKKAIWGPVQVNGVSQFPIYHDLGVGIYEDKLNWASIAPTQPAHPADPNDPAYRWPADLDLAVSEAKRYHMRIALQVIDSPSWASGHKQPFWAPTSPWAFATFLRAAARRYPSVHLWMIWGEPSTHFNFMPLTAERRGHSLNRAQRVAPHLYARILDASYRSLKRESRRNLVIGGNTFVTGDISPLNWIKNLRLPNGRPPRMDLYGHNPFSSRRPSFGRPPLGFGFADFSNLPQLSGWVDRYLARPRHKRHLDLFLSELFWPTDHPNYEFNFWVTQSTAASWLTVALRNTERWSRIYALGWFSLYDDPPNAKGDEVNRGLLTWTGKRKPAYYSYRSG